MNQPEAQVRTADLDAVLDCLGGLEMILLLFEAKAPGSNHADVTAGLIALHNDDELRDAFRYNGEESMGFGLVAHSMSELRERHLEG